MAIHILPSTENFTLKINKCEASMFRVAPQEFLDGDQGLRGRIIKVASRIEVEGNSLSAASPPGE